MVEVKRYTRRMNGYPVQDLVLLHNPLHPRAWAIAHTVVGERATRADIAIALSDEELDLFIAAREEQP